MNLEWFLFEFAGLFRGEESSEGMRAFMEKRKPAWLD